MAGSFVLFVWPLASVWLQVSHTDIIGLLCAWCTAAVAFIAYRTRTVASEFNLIIPSQSSTGHIIAEQQVGSHALSHQLWQTPSI